MSDISDTNRSADNNGYNELVAVIHAEHQSITSVKQKPHANEVNRMQTSCPASQACATSACPALPAPPPITRQCSITVAANKSEEKRNSFLIK